MSDLAARLGALSLEERRRVLEEFRSRQRGDGAPPLPRVAWGGGDFPLSFAQERLWFLDQMSPGSPFYNISSAQRIPFVVEQEALDRALTELVRRHGALRTIYPVVQGAPVQRVLPPGPVRCATADLRSLGRAEQAEELRHLAEQSAQRPFDLAAGPVFRTTLIRLGPFESAFLLVIHHIAADNTSMDILFRELGTLYADEAVRRAPSVQGLPAQYADFAVWQRDWLRGERLAKQVGYWERQLANLGTLELPTDRPRPPVQTYRGAQLDVKISKETRRALDALARASSATPFMLLLAAFYALLHRYSGQDDLAVGVPIANRTRRELEGVVGFFANSLVLRADLSGNPTFRTALARVREMALEAYSHQDIPFSTVVAVLRPQKDLSRNPLFQVSFQLVSHQEGGRDAAGNPAVAFERGTAIFDLALNLWEQGEEARGVLEYNTDLFDRETAERMARHYLTLLDSIAENPDAPIGSLALLSAEERRRALVEWNGTDAPYPESTIHVLVEEQAARTPDATAVEQGTTKLTYRELNARAAALAGRIRDCDGRMGRGIGVMLPSSIELIAGILGILKSGNAYVPLDPATPSGRLAQMLDVAEVEMVVTLAATAGRVPAGRQVVAMDANGPDGRSGGAETSPTDLAYIIFTSGSTGTPKGVKVSHRSVVNYLAWCRRTYPMGTGMEAPLCSPPWSDMSVTTLFLPLICGGRIVVLDQTDVVEALDTALRRGHRFGFVKLTPSHLEALRSLSLGRPAPRNTEAFIVGGEALHGETLALWRDEAEDVTIFNEYGPTETVVGCALYAARAGEIGPGPVPIGRPIANTRLYVLDRYGEPVPVGVPGELYIGGAGVALGYAGAPRATDEKFLPDSFCAGGCMYRTGDLARYQADGTLEFLGRLDRQVKIRGYRVEPGDVEATIRRHPAVADAAVTARDFGRGDRRLLAHVVLAQTEMERTAVLQEVRDFVRTELPEYMVPSTFTVIRAVPLTSAGKVDAKALEKAVPETEKAAVPVPPATALERVIAAVLEDVLGVSRISVEDDFFANLGGHSLLATKAVARLRDLLHVDLPLRWIFEAPTVRGLAAALLRHDAAWAPETERVAEMVVTVLGMPEDQVRAQLASSIVNQSEQPATAANAGDDSESICV